MHWYDQLWLIKQWYLIDLPSDLVSNLFSVIYFKGRDHALTNIDNDIKQSKTNKQSINLSDDSRTMGYETALEIYHSCACVLAHVSA